MGQAKKVPVQQRIPHGPGQKRTELAMAQLDRPAMLDGFSHGDTGSRKEIVFKITDFFDSGPLPDTSGQYVFNTTQNLWGDGIEHPIEKILSVKLYALPRFSLDSISSSVQVLFGVPVLNGGAPTNASQQSTYIMPTSVPNWIKVGGWSSNELFRDAMVRPLTNSAGDRMPLCTWAVVDPDDFTASAVQIQFKIVYEVSQAIPLSDLTSFYITNTPLPPWNTIATGNVSNQRTMIETMRLTDSQ